MTEHEWQDWRKNVSLFSEKVSSTSLSETKLCQLIHDISNLKESLLEIKDSLSNQTKSANLFKEVQLVFGDEIPSDLVQDFTTIECWTKESVKHGGIYVEHILRFPRLDLEMIYATDGMNHVVYRSDMVFKDKRLEKCSSVSDLMKQIRPEAKPVCSDVFVYVINTLDDEYRQVWERWVKE